MACQACNRIILSNDRKQFCPPEGTVNTLDYQCQECGQWYVQFNPHYHLWQLATKQEVDEFRRADAEAIDWSAW